MSNDVVNVLLGVVVGALATAAAEHLFWRVQHRETLRESRERAEREERQREERASREQKQRVAEQLRQTAGGLIELARLPVQGIHIDQSYLTTINYVELLRVKRELLDVVALARDAFPEQQEFLSAFQRHLDEAILNPSTDRMDQLRVELDSLLRDFTKSQGRDE